MDDLAKEKINELTKRALSHGVDLSGGLGMIPVVEKLIGRLDLYRADQKKSLPENNKGRILIE